MSLHRTKTKSGVCQVRDCGCLEAFVAISHPRKKKKVRAIKQVKAPWNPQDADARRAVSPDRGARYARPLPLPGDGGLPVAVAGEMAPYSNMGFFTKKQAADAEKEFQKFLRLRNKNVKANIGKGEYYD
jgi:hypothetical protein